MPQYKVVEKGKKIVHLITWSRKRGEEWIERYGDSKIFMDKTLTKECFEVIQDEK